MRAVEQWQYRPYLLNHEPVEVQTQVTVNFVLNF
jgi:Gram-negative bacterial TonB protein C-terminal